MLEELRTLVLFAEEGSIQNVARRLPLTQPAVTRQIQRLEEMLGTTLLDRRQKPPRLTAAGSEVLARAKHILASVQALKAFAADAEPQGVLRVGLAHGLSDASVAGAIAGAAAAFPNYRCGSRLAGARNSSSNSNAANSTRRSFCDLPIISARTRSASNVSASCRLAAPKPILQTLGLTCLGFLAPSPATRVRNSSQVWANGIGSLWRPKFRIRQCRWSGYVVGTASA